VILQNILNLTALPFHRICEILSCTKLEMILRVFTMA